MQKPNHISDRPLLNMLHMAMVDAIKKVDAERGHHATCTRAIMTFPEYAELKSDKLRQSVRIDRLSDDQRKIIVRHLEQILASVEVSKIEILSDFESVNRRSVIVLADLMEGVLETVTGSFLLHLTPDERKNGDMVEVWTNS